MNRKNNDIIVKIDLSNKSYGGRIYENQFIKLLKDEIDFKQIYLLRHKQKILNLPWAIYVFIKYHFFYSGHLILTNHTTWIAGKKSQNLVIVHHVDTDTSSGLSGMFQRLCDRALYRYKTRYKYVVTVSEYWKNHLTDSGFSNIRVIYNSFDTTLYDFSENEIFDFKKRYNLTGKPIAYLGNCQKQKGVVESYKALCDLDAHFVTSGIKDVEIPARHLYLSFKEYRLLLAASDVVVTMSSLTEGWNRTAHEAMLCGTPVIGSATGGMLELFSLGGGKVCGDFSELNQMVRQTLDMKKRGVPDALKKFDLSYFRDSWYSVIKDYLK